MQNQVHELYPCKPLHKLMTEKWNSREREKISHFSINFRISKKGRRAATTTFHTTHTFPRLFWKKEAFLLKGSFSEKKELVACFLFEPNVAAPELLGSD